MSYENMEEILGNVYFNTAIGQLRESIESLVEDLIAQYVPNFDDLDSGTQDNVRNSIYVELLERA